MLTPDLQNENLNEEDQEDYRNLSKWFFTRYCPYYIQRQAVFLQTLLFTIFQAVNLDSYLRLK